MKIIEALKELKLIEKKMESNIRNINQYASAVSTERPFFGDEESQKKEVSSLVQSNEDLVTRYLELKRKIEMTNLLVTAEFEGKKYALSDLLTLQRRLGEYRMRTYNALNTNYADTRIKVAPPELDGKKAQVIRLYDERKKNESLASIMDLQSNISARLEVINATTDITEKIKYNASDA